jgi:hypothetical protein
MNNRPPEIPKSVKVELDDLLISLIKDPSDHKKSWQLVHIWNEYRFKLNGYSNRVRMILNTCDYLYVQEIAGDYRVRKIY